MSTQIVDNQIGCVSEAALFQDPLVEDSPSGLSRSDRRRQMMLLNKAALVCESCPFLEQCLYTAVVRHEVSGMVAGTTQQQRRMIRRKLGIKVASEDFDVISGAPTPHRQVDHQEVIRLRTANPHEPLEALATRLGCSLSTVKRHLRKAREGGSERPVLQPVTPSLELVKQAYLNVLGKETQTSGQQDTEQTTEKAA